MRRITAVEPLLDFRVRLRFDDGVAGELDLGHLAGAGVFRIWQEPGGFASVHIGELGELVWGDQVDLCPDALYLRLTGLSPESLFPGLQRAADHA